VHNFVSWAGPNDGVYGVPDFNALCPDADCPWLANAFDALLSSGASPLLQKTLTFAAYWKDPLNMSTYRSSNLFLADINNERAAKNATYKANLASLNHLALAHATKDLIVVPSRSEWFEFFPSGTSKRPLTKWNEGPAYTEDWIGLRTLDEAGKLTHWQVACSHQDVPRDDCKDEAYVQVTRDLLNNTLP